MDERTLPVRRASLSSSSFSATLTTNIPKGGREEERSHPPSEEEEEEARSIASGEPRRTCRCIWTLSHFCKACLKRLIPSVTPLFMMTTIFVASIIMIVNTRLEEGWGIMLPYLIYDVISFSIFFLFFIIRLMWIYFISPHLNETRVSVALSAILDPELTYFCATMSLTLFWAYFPATGFQGQKFGEILGLNKISPSELRVLLEINLFLVLWTIRDTLLSFIVFKFLTRLLMTLNSNLVKYLSVYRLIRKLDAAWLRLCPLYDTMLLGQPQKRSADGSAVPLESTKSAMFHERDITHREIGRYSLKGWKRDPKIEALRELARWGEELGGEDLPSTLSKSNIKKTETDGVANLLAIEFCRQYHAIVFIGPTALKLLNKHDAQEAGQELFDKIIEFRDSFITSPLETKTQEERNAVARQAIISIRQSVQEFKANRTASLRDILRRRHASKRKGQYQIGIVKSNIQMNSENSYDYPQQQQQDFFRNEQELRSCIPSFCNTLYTTANNNTNANMISDDVHHHDCYSIDLTPILQWPWNDSRIPEADPIPENLEISDNEEDFYNDFLENEKYPIIEWRDELEHGAQQELATQLKTKLHETFSKSIYLTRDFISVLMESETDEFMSVADPGGRGRVSKRNFVKIVIDVYKYRKQLVHLVASQETLKKIVSRTVSAFLVFFMVLIFLLITGVQADTIIISGAAVVSAVTVMLSFIYTGFVQAMIFVCFLNPYNVGDRIIFDNKVRTVKKIHTYFTEFITMLGQVETMNHSTLFTTVIANDTRCIHAGLEIPLLVEYSTPQSKYEALHYLVEQYVQNHTEFVKDSFFCIINDIVIGDYVKFTYWITVVDSWGLWKSVHITKATLIKYIQRQSKALGITYKKPILPIEVREVNFDNFLK